MSWVLILNSGLIQKPPAVVGGYPTREEAERAGDLATAITDREQFQRLPYYTHYLVIPGAACSEPAGMTSSFVDHGDNYKLERYTRRWP